jgi:hypothetical protein
MSIAISGSSITFPDQTQMSTATGGSFRNRIINGDMRIDQRNAGASQSITAASPSYSVDRFIVRPIGATVTGQRVAGTGSTQFVYQLTGAASVTQLQFEQRIEASNSYDLAGGNATLSVNLSNSLLTTASWVLYYATATDNFASNTLISSGSWTVSSSIARYSANITIPALATTGLYLIIYVGAQTSGTFKIGDVQLEAGSTATEFERRPIGTELALCQRYYTDAGAGWVGIEETATTFYTSIPFVVVMRATPTATIIFSDISTRIAGAPFDRTISGCAFSTYTMSSRGGWLYFTCSGGNVAGRMIFDRSGASIVRLSAEL